MADADAEQDPARVAEAMRAAVDAPIEVGGDAPVQVGVSIGTALHPADGDAFTTLYHAADLRMYERKRAR